jgi:iron complex outermembrane receptor protein
MQHRAWFLAMTAVGSSVAGVAAQAADAENSSGELAEIVITSQKRTERLSDVPVAASVVSAGALESRNAGDITDLNNIVPSVNLVGTFNGRVPLGIRGISSNANEATVGIASGVAIMVDGVPIPSDSQSGNQLEDVKSVEVLKGPQATLGGRTASAGIINIVTRGPTDHLTADMSATGTSDGEVRFNGFLAGPLTSGLEGSVSLYSNVRKFPIINEANDEKSNQHNNGVRGKLLFQPSEQLDITLMADYHTSNSQGSNLTYRYLTPGAFLLFGTTPPPLPPPIVNTLSQGAVLTGITPSTTNDRVNTPVLNSGSRIKDLNFSVNADYRLGDLTLGSTTAFQHETAYNLQDLFVDSSYFSNNFRNAFAAIIGPIPGSPGTWATFNNTQFQAIDVKQTSEELKLLSPTDVALSYVVGVFFSDQKVTLGTGRTFTPAETGYDTATDTKTYDVYGRGTLKLSAENSLIAGIRYNSDHLSYGYSQTDGGAINTSNSDTSSAVVGDLSLQHKFSPRTMVYATYARGYAPKVFNTGIYSGGNAVAPPTPLDATGQEHINHFEIGSKGTFLDQRLTVDAAVFYTEYLDYQVQSSAAIPGVPAPVEELDSAGKARTAGVEFDTAFAATEMLRIDFNAAYIDARFVDYKDAPCWGNGVIQTAALGCHARPADPANPAAAPQLVQDVSGDTMPNSPRFKGTVAVEQRFPVGDDFELALGGNYSYRARAQFQPDQNPETIQGAFGLLNLNVGLRTRSHKYSVTAFCNNVTNHFYATDIEDFWSPPYNSNAVVMQPARDALRYFGLRFNVGL